MYSVVYSLGFGWKQLSQVHWRREGLSDARDCVKPLRPKMPGNEWRPQKTLWCLVCGLSSTQLALGAWASSSIWQEKESQELLLCTPGSCIDEASLEGDQVAT